MNTYRIFISHAWKYGDDYDKLICLLDAAAGFNYVNYSAPEDKPLELSRITASRQEIETKITNKIRPVNTVLVLSGMYTVYSGWMQYEINEAVRLGKRIVAIVPRGQERMPSAVSNVADEIVGWSTQSIVKAIRGW